MSKKKTIYFHIGNHKTGTSSLQLFFKKKSNYFLKHNLLYPIEKQSTNHHNVSWQAIKHFYFNKNGQSIEKLLNIIKKNRNLNVLISSENFENLKFSKKFKVFLLTLKKTHNFKIIWSVREQFSYALSLLTMLINKGAYLKNFDMFFKKILKDGVFIFKPYIFWFDYYKQYKLIKNIFGVNKNDIFLIIYSKNSNVFENFCRVLSINLRVKKKLIEKNTSKLLFQNKKNLKNWLKDRLGYKKNFFTKDLLQENSDFLINKKKTVFFSKDAILYNRSKLVKHFKKSNLKLFKTFSVSKKKIKNFYVTS